MRKTFIKCVLLAAFFTLTTIAVSADCEKIERAGVEVNKEIVTVNTSNLMCDSQPIYGNGMYLQVTNVVDGTNVSSLPDKYKNADYSNSPIYVYDENLNYVKSIEFDGVIAGFDWIDGYFYFQQTIYGDNIYDKEIKYYKSADMANWNELNYDEYMMSKRRVTLHNGMQYTWKTYSYELDGIIYNTRKTVEYLIDNDGMYNVKREHEDYISGVSKEATYFNVYTMSKRSLENYNDSSLITNYISLDGVSMFEIPKDADTNDIWNDDEYIYVGIRQDDTYCYRIPISNMSNCIKVKYNGTYLSFATNPIIEKDRTLVPIRFIFEQMGASVDWDSFTRTAVIKKGNDIISFSIDDKKARVNNKSKIMDVPARLIDGKTMIPIRFFSQELGYKVDWDKKTNTVKISDKKRLD